MLTALVLAASIAANVSAAAQPPIDVALKKAIVQKLETALRDVYVFPDVGQKTAAHLAERLAAGAYEDARTPDELSNALTTDMRAIAHDKHLAVWLVPPERAGASTRSDDDARARNYGVQKLEHLAGNVGYLDLREFDDPVAASATIEGAMNFVGNSDAVIIDLRSNGGGKPATVQLVASYFFATSQHLVDIYHREGNRTDQLWTLPVVEGHRMPDVPLFLLTSSRTFSGGEGLAYTLQALKRATVIGEVTAGAANPGQTVPLAAGFVAFIPNGRTISPVTHANWDGTGVKPDIEVAADKAFDTAYVKALEAIESHAQTPEQKAAIERVLHEEKAAAGSH